MVNNLLEYAQKNNILLEVLKERNKSTTIYTYNDSIESYDSYDIYTYKLKAIYNNKTIMIETENIDDPQKIIEIIKNNANLIENQNRNILADKKIIMEEKSSYCKENFKEIIDDMIDFSKFRKKYSNLVSINASYESIYKEVGIYNINDCKLEDNNYYISCFAEIVMSFNGVNKTCYKYYYDKKYDKDKFYNMVENLIKETQNKENSKSVLTQKYNILLDSKCVSDLLKHFSYAFTAKAIDKGISLIKNKFNKKIFSDKITIIEDPKNNNYIGKRVFDDEGIETTYKEIVQNGVFKTKLYNMEMAIKEDTKSTGNSYGVRNLYIKPGFEDKESVLKEMTDGIYITNIEGLHAGINDTTGNISLQAEGYLMHQGNKQEFLNMIILSTNLFELFSNVKKVCNDLQFYGVECGAPSILCENITVAGNN